MSIPNVVKLSNERDSLAAQLVEGDGVMATETLSRVPAST